MNIGIAGAGLAGRLLAYALSHQGHQVQVFDPALSATDPVAAGWTAAGMLSPLAELESGDQDVYELGVRSLTLWQQIVPQLAQPVETRFKGSLMLAHRGDEGAAERMISLLERKSPDNHDLPEPIDLNTLHELEPSIQGPAHAWVLAKEGQIHTRQAMAALAASCPNVHWHWGQTVTELTPYHLKTADQTYTFDWVFDTRGVGARRLKHPHPTELSCQNVRGVRGEVFWLKAPNVVINRPLRLLHPRYRVYIVPRAPDTVVIGASEIESEDRSPVSLRTTVELLTAAHSVIPALSEARLIHTETNLRPALVDNFPRIENESGLTRINGLFRHGWLISPALIDRALQLSLQTPLLAHHDDSDSH